ncbi:sulfate permease (SulP) family inorganic anion transporter [Aeromonas salmonicida subsp. salmonicida 01-B526]|uniref:Sulfate permease (SulP) family inorganic anion transporter n=1 Tax=Aeromonas salmonicida subsp. salmonicida 01-B526 TaxID=1076135 RepID=A0ABN0E2Q2_AERSS|nr:sulfate permease (SulP) family inorganic anion transporter [Aeromonas salmonicida subsp. salmonicida 01-B526]
MLERLFALQGHGTTARTEVIAGITTFLTMVYIVFVNPQILSAAGMDTQAVFVTTCLIAGIGSILMGLLAHRPGPGHGTERLFRLRGGGWHGLFLASRHGHHLLGCHGSADPHPAAGSLLADRQYPAHPAGRHHSRYRSAHRPARPTQRRYRSGEPGHHGDGGRSHLPALPAGAARFLPDLHLLSPRRSLRRADRHSGDHHPGLAVWRCDLQGLCLHATEHRAGVWPAGFDGVARHQPRRDHLLLHAGQPVRLFRYPDRRHQPRQAGGRQGSLPAHEAGASGGQRELGRRRLHGHLLCHRLYREQLRRRRRRPHRPDRHSGRPAVPAGDLLLPRRGHGACLCRRRRTHLCRRADVLRADPGEVGRPDRSCARLHDSCHDAVQFLHYGGDRHRLYLLLRDEGRHRPLARDQPLRTGGRPAVRAQVCLGRQPLNLTFANKNARHRRAFFMAGR